GFVHSPCGQRNVPAVLLPRSFLRGSFELLFPCSSERSEANRALHSLLTVANARIHDPAGGRLGISCVVGVGFSSFWSLCRIDLGWRERLANVRSAGPAEYTPY